VVIKGRAIASQIVEPGGDDVMLDEDNQPQLREEIATVFAHAPMEGNIRTEAEPVDVGLGIRLENHMALPLGVVHPSENRYNVTIRHVSAIRWNVRILGLDQEGIWLHYDGLTNRSAKAG